MISDVANYKECNKYPCIDRFHQLMNKKNYTPNRGNKYNSEQSSGCISCMGTNVGSQYVCPDVKLGCQCPGIQEMPLGDWFQKQQPTEPNPACKTCQGDSHGNPRLNVCKTCQPILGRYSTGFCPDFSLCSHNPCEKKTIEGFSCCSTDEKPDCGDTVIPVHNWQYDPNETKIKMSPNNIMSCKKRNSCGCSSNPDMSNISNKLDALLNKNTKPIIVVNKKDSCGSSCGCDDPCNCEGFQNANVNANVNTNANVNANVNVNANYRNHYDMCGTYKKICPYVKEDRDHSYRHCDCNRPISWYFDTSEPHVGNRPIYKRLATTCQVPDSITNDTINHLPEALLCTDKQPWDETCC